MNHDTIDTPENNDYGHLYTYLELTIESEKLHQRNLVAKQTIVNSPTILDIYRDVKVRKNKPFKGLSSRLLNDAEYQYLTPPEEDSQMDVFDEDDEILEELDTSAVEMTQMQKEEQPKFVLAQVLVKYHSLLINGVDFRFKSAVRSSCVIRASLAQEEDHILVSLKSGFLLLIRIFLVLRQTRDVDYGYKPSPKNANLMFKPFIVQWWNLQQKSNYPELNTSGFVLKSSPSGLSTVSCSASQSFRIYKTLEQSNSGTVLQNHLNVPLNGFMVDSCFIESKTAMQTDIFLALVFTEHRRLYIQLFSWFSFYSGDSEISKSSLPLENTFQIPIFIAPLVRSSAFLFVSPHELTVVFVHDIISGHHEFHTAKFRMGSFPTNFYTPRSQIRNAGDSEVDEIIISSDIGVIYSILVSKSGIESIQPIARVPDNITTFTFEKAVQGYELVYASTSGSNKSILINRLYDAEYTCDIEDDTKLSYSKVEYLDNLDNWAPVIDFQIVPASMSSETDVLQKDELWAITGSASKSKISHIKNGYYGAKKDECYPELRKVVNSWLLELQDRTILVCAFPFETKVMELEGLESEEIFEVEDAEICKDEQTIFCGIIRFTNLPNIAVNDIDYMVQVTTSSVIVTDLGSECTCISNECIIFAEMLDNRLFVIVEREAKTIFYAYALEPISTTEDLLNINARVVSEMSLDFQPSMMTKCTVRGVEALSVGAYEGFIKFYLPNEVSLSEIDEIASKDFATNFIPHDLISAKSGIYIGTADGYLARFSQKSLSCESYLRIGDSEVKVYRSEDEDFVYIQCRDLYLMNLTDNIYPKIVQFNDLIPKIVNALIELPTTTEYPAFKRLGLFRNNGFVFAHITTYTQPVVKQVRIPDDTKKLLLLPHISIFLLLGSSRKSKLKFIDRQTFRVLEHSEVSSKRSNGEEVFGKDEICHCACIWTIKRHNKTTHKVLLGCSNNIDGKSTGLVKVLNIRKLKSNETPPVSVFELSSFDHYAPVTQIQ